MHDRLTRRLNTRPGSHSIIRYARLDTDTIRRTAQTFFFPSWTPTLSSSSTSRPPTPPRRPQPQQQQHHAPRPRYQEDLPMPPYRPLPTALGTARWGPAADGLTVRRRCGPAIGWPLAPWAAPCFLQTPTPSRRFALPSRLAMRLHLHSRTTTTAAAADDNDNEADANADRTRAGRASIPEWGDARGRVSTPRLIRPWLSLSRPLMLDIQGP